MLYDVIAQLVYWHSVSTKIMNEYNEEYANTQQSLKSHIACILLSMLMLCRGNSSGWRPSNRGQQITADSKQVCTRPSCASGERSAKMGKFFLPASFELPLQDPYF